MKLYLKYAAMILRSQMQHKFSFFMTAIGQFLSSFAAMLAVQFMFTRFDSVAGFTYSEVLLCYATVLMAFSIAECFARGFDTFDRIISNGEFDRIMVRPRGAIFQVLASHMEFSRVGRFLQAIIVLVYALITVDVIWSADKILTLILMIFGGTLMFSGLFVIYAALCFFTTQGLEFINIFTDGGREYGVYPYVIYGKNILKFFTYIIPLALFQYYPLLYLTDRTSQSWYMLLPLAGIPFLALCYLLWRIGVHRYKSTGS